MYCNSRRGTVTRRVFDRDRARLRTNAVTNRLVAPTPLSVFCARVVFLYPSTLDISDSVHTLGKLSIKRRVNFVFFFFLNRFISHDPIVVSIFNRPPSRDNAAMRTCPLYFHVVFVITNRKGGPPGQNKIAVYRAIDPVVFGVDHVKTLRDTPLRVAEHLKSMLSHYVRTLNMYNFNAAARFIKIFFYRSKVINLRIFHRVVTDSSIVYYQLVA